MTSPHMRFANLRDSNSIDIWEQDDSSVHLKHSFAVSQLISGGQVAIKVLRIAFELDDVLFVECLSMDEQRYYLLSLPLLGEQTANVGMCSVHVDLSLTLTL